MNHKEQDIKHTDTYINHTATEKMEFALQKRLKQCSPSLHSETIWKLHRSLYEMLDRYRNVFPSIRTTAAFLPEYYESGRTAGGRLSVAAEWKRAACAFDGDSFHDLGMISKADFEGPAPVLCGELYPAKGREAELIREYHQEFSALLVENTVIFLKSERVCISCYAGSSRRTQKNGFR